MAIADLGVMDMWWGLLSDFSPLTDRRNIYEEEVSAEQVAMSGYPHSCF